MTDYNKIELAKQVILDIIVQLGIDAKIDYEESITKGLVFNISSPDSYLLIGRQGTTLNALQILSHALVNRKMHSDPNADQQTLWFSLDVDDYKIKREWLLKETAKAAAQKAKMTGRQQALEPMPNYERRLVHAYLQEHEPNVESYSIDNEPYRRIVIKPKQ